MTGWMWARVAAYAVVVAVGVGGFWIDHQQDVDRCRARNESTEDSVRIVVDAVVAAASDADPDRVAGFREDIDRRLAAARVRCT